MCAADNVADTDTGMRACKKCNVIQPVAAFTKSRATCLTCIRERQIAYTAANKEKRAAYKAANKEKNAAYSRAYRAANKEKVSAYNKAYNLNNRATIQPRSSRNYQRLLDTNPAFKMAHAFRCRTRKVIRGELKSGNSLKLLGCTADQLKSWLEFNFIDGMTFENHGTFWHIDHVIPCSRFNLADPEHQRQCFHWANLKPMLARANLSKNGNVILEEIPYHVGRIVLFLNCADID